MSAIKPWARQRLTLLLVSGLVSACQPPAETRVLQVSVKGPDVYRIDGRPVARDALRDVLKDAQQRPGAVELQVTVDGAAGFAPMGVLIKAAADAGIPAEQVHVVLPETSASGAHSSTEAVSARPTDR